MLIPTGLQIMLLAGTLLALGLVLAGLWLAPARPDAADVVARLSGTSSRHTVAAASASSGSAEDDVQEKLGLAAMRLLPDSAWAKTPTKDLALVRKSDSFYLFLVKDKRLGIEQVHLYRQILSVAEYDVITHRLLV